MKAYNEQKGCEVKFEVENEKFFHAKDNHDIDMIADVVGKKAVIISRLNGYADYVFLGKNFCYLTASNFSKKDCYELLANWYS